MYQIKRSPIVAWLTFFSLLISFCSVTAFAGNAGQGVATSSIDNVQFPSLSRFATDLTAQAKAGKLAATSEHDAEVDRVIEILSAGTRNNAVLIGEAGAETRLVAEAVAVRIASGNVPQGMTAKHLFALNLDKLVSGYNNATDLAGRLQSVLDETAASKGEVILFAPELQHFIGTRASQAGSRSLTDALKRGDLQVMGVASAAAFDQYIKDESADLFQQVRVAELETASRGEAGRNANDYIGDKVSPDLRDMLRNATASDRVTVIIQVADINSGKLNDLFSRYGARVEARLEQLGALAVNIPVSAVEELAANSNSRYISLDQPTQTLGYSHVENTTGAANVRSGVLSSATVDGTGVGIAIIDSGIWDNHSLLKNGLVIKSVDFTGENILNGDPFGHGTHVAGLAAASNSLLSGTFTGIAPNAKLINLRVLNGQGVGTSAALLQALDWALANRTAYNIRVVNISLGAMAVSSYNNDPACRAVRRLADAGVVVVAAAGNNGKDANGNKVYGHIHSPAIEPSAITVGASNSMGSDVRSDDIMTSYSSRGPTRGYWTDASGVRHYDNLVKPDLVAPGNKLFSAKSQSNLLSGLDPLLDLSSITNVADDEMALSGTSMASPIVAGAAALMLQVNPKLTPNMVKALLMYTAQPLRDANQFDQGAGQLNIDGAVRLAKLVRTDITNSTAVGSPLLTSGAPAPQSTIAGQSFVWGQGLIMGKTFATGTDFITKNQGVYRSGIVLSDGITVSSNVLGRSGILLSDGVTVSNRLVANTGVLLSDGRDFAACGILLSDGVLLSDGIVLSDGFTLRSDGVLLSDGLQGQATLQAFSSMLAGDDTPSMNPVIPQ